MNPKNVLNNDETKKDLDKIKEIEKNVDIQNLINETNDYTYSFKNFQTIKIFGRDIYKGKITLGKANKYQANLLAEIINFKKNTRPRSLEEKQEKEIVFNNLYNFLKVKKKFLMFLKSKYFW